MRNFALSEREDRLHLNKKETSFFVLSSICTIFAVKSHKTAKNERISIEVRM